jgi:hypothetical protein
LRLQEHEPREVSADIVDKGTTHFAKGEVHCKEATYGWMLAHRSVEFDYSFALETWDSPTVAWSIDGIALSPTASSVQIPGKQVRLYPPPPYGQSTNRTVTLDFQMPSADRLVLRNRPTDGNYEVSLTCVVTNRVGTGNLQTWIKVEGQVLAMDPQFARDLAACRAVSEIKHKANRQRRRVILPPDIWLPREPEVRIEVERTIRLLSVIGDDEVAAVRNELAHTLRFDSAMIQLQTLPPETRRMSTRSPIPMAESSRCDMTDATILPNADVSPKQ